MDWTKNPCLGPFVSGFDEVINSFVFNQCYYSLDQAWFLLLVYPHSGFGSTREGIDDFYERKLGQIYVCLLTDRKSVV